MTEEIPHTVTVRTETGAWKLTRVSWWDLFRGRLVDMLPALFGSVVALGSLALNEPDAAVWAGAGILVFALSHAITSKGVYLSAKKKDPK